MKDIINKTSLWVCSNQSTFSLFVILSLLFIASVVFLPKLQTVVPTQGGAIKEGIIGQPRFVNPVLAMSSTDRSLSKLIFAGLYSTDIHGDVVEDLAYKHTTSSSSDRYTISLDPSRVFHSGAPVTSEDVVFTFELITDPLIKSPLAPVFTGVEIEASDNHTVVFTLEKANKNFINNLQFGILSKKHWQGTSPEEFPFALHNVSPIGAGPYKISSINRNHQEQITSYILTAHQQESSKGAFISTIDLIFFATQQEALRAFESGQIDNLANISPQELLSLDRTLRAKNIQSYPLDRAFVLYLNQDRHVILENEVIRQTIRQVIDKQGIIDEVLFGRARVSDGPLAPSHSYYSPSSPVNEVDEESYQKALQKLGWKLNDAGRYIKDNNILTLRLDIPQVEEITRTADFIKQDLASIGIEVVIVAHNQQDLVEQIIRKREYEMLIFGQLSNNINSLYAFWHSSAQSDPGINVALYENKTVDAILERLASESAPDSKAIDYKNLQKEIRDDVGAIFLYHPHFIYAVDQSIKNVSLQNANFAWDRFNGITTWYTHTEFLLPWFVK